MKMKSFLIIIFLLLNISFANAYELATEISNNNGKVILSSSGYAKLGLIKVSTSSKGMISLNGTVSVYGKANIVMWAKVDRNYYFSKLPALQNIYNQKNVNFQIPFNAAEKTITEVILEVELMGGGKVAVENIKLING
jgi:hypothetical protein